MSYVLRASSMLVFARGADWWEIGMQAEVRSNVKGGNKHIAARRTVRAQRSRNRNQMRSFAPFGQGIFYNDRGCICSLNLLPVYPTW